MPTIALAVAVTLAWPSDPMVAVAAERFADAPPAFGLTVKLTTPPATGSTGSFAVTMTARALAKLLLIVVDCGVLPATVVHGEALALEGADVGRGSSRAARRAGRW